MKQFNNRYVLYSYCARGEISKPGLITLFPLCLENDISCNITQQEAISRY